MEYTQQEDTAAENGSNRRLLDEIANARWVRCFAALVLLFLATWLLNQYVFPRFTLVYGMAREFATVSSFTTNLVVAIAASLRPNIFEPRKLAGFAVLIGAVGLAMVAAGLASANPAVLTIGSIAMNAGRALASVLACIVLISLSPRAAAVGIAGSLATAYVLRIAFVALPGEVGTIAFALSPFAIIALAYPSARPILERIRTNPGASTLALTEPRAFLPYSHILFVSFFVFRIAFGFSLMFGESDGMPQFTLLALLPLAVVAVQTLVAGKAAPADILYQVASLFVLAGFLCVLVPQFEGTAAPNILLAAGSDCFTVLVYYALAAIGRRNPLHALPIFAWGQFATGAGSLVGTSLGHLTNGLLVDQPLLVPGAVVLVVLAFSAFNLLVLRTFSFEKTIEGIESVPLLEPTAEPESDRSDAIEAQCARIAERFALTERETDVFKLLAKGRTVPFIEEELVISRNTIKTHIKHIYQKMDLHSQQELIDMVETY